MKFKKYTGAAIALAMLNVTVAQADVIRSEADINDVENNSYDEVSENMDQANLEVEPRNDHNAEIISGRHEDINNEISELEMPEQYNDEDFIQEEVDSTIFTGGDLEEVSGEELTEDELSDFTEYNPEDSVEDYFASINEINFTHTRGREALSRLSNGANLVGAYDAILNYLKKVHSGQRNLSIIQSGGTYYTEKIDISAYSLTIDEYKKVFLTIRYDNPQFFWIGTKYAYTRTSDNKVVKGLLKVENHFTSSEKIQASKRQLNNVIQEYLSEVSSLTDEYDIEKAFHDKLIRQTIYDPYYNDNYMINVNSHNVLGVLVDHVGVCESYAKAMQMLLTAKGIENLYLTGRVSGGGHAWNQVKIHGQYYNLDVTWDDKDSMESGGISYKYFNVPNSIFYRNHTANDTTATVGTNEFLYEKENCTAAEYCWDKTLSYADSNDETKIHEFIVNAIEKNLRTNNYDIFLNGQDNSVVEKINLYLNSNREDILSDSLISDLIRERTTGEYFNNPINNSVELCFVRNSQQIPATSITMPDEKRITVLKNSKYLSPIVDPDNTTSSIVWSSSNSSVARVDPKGCIVPLQTGEATITATMGSVRAQCLVKVESPLYIDTTGLQRLYYDNLNKDESTYTLTAWQAFQSALRSAYKILNIGNPTQSEVNDAISVLQNAINGLVQRGDKSALQSLYDQCVDKVESEYSQSTWQPFKDALDAALIVLNNEDAVQSEIDNAKEDLQNGVDNLISLVRFNELRQLYNNNINRNQDDYVSSTWLVFESALGNAQSVLENDNASDRDIISAK